MALFSGVDKIPIRTRAKRGSLQSSLQSSLKEIQSSGFRYVKLGIDNYKTSRIQANCYRVAIKRAGLNWAVYDIDGSVYIDTGYLCH